MIWAIRSQLRRHRSALSLPQFRALVRIDLQPDASLSAVAEHLGLSLSSASRIIAALGDAGLLARRDSRADRRQLVLALTAKGAAVLARARAAAQHDLQRQLGALNAQQLDTIAAAMGTLRAAFAPVATRPPRRLRPTSA